jgi:hypothetical protein
MDFLFFREMQNVVLAFGGKTKSDCDSSWTFYFQVGPTSRKAPANRGAITEEPLKGGFFLYL